MKKLELGFWVLSRFTVVKQPRMRRFHALTRESKLEAASWKALQRAEAPKQAASWLTKS